MEMFGHIPSGLSFVCAVITVIMPLSVNLIVKKIKSDGEPPWKKNR